MISSFQGKNRWLSNFWPCKVELDGLEFHSTEAAYQAAKSLDTDARALFQNVPGAMAKRMGQYINVRPDWEEVRVRVMYDLLVQKFSKRNPELREQLKATGTQQLVEGNTWGDVFWGVCRGQGENVLGKLLMQVRAEVLTEDA